MGKKKSVKTEIVHEVEEAPLEAYAPHAAPLQNEDFLIRGCDGDIEYVWIAEKRNTFFCVTEVYPGLSAPETELREAADMDDLVFSVGALKTLDKVLDELTERLFEGFDAASIEQMKLLARKSLPSSSNAPVDAGDARSSSGVNPR